MAFCIDILKIDDTVSFAVYRYEFRISTGLYRNPAGKLRGSSKLVGGVIKIMKESGDVEIMELAEGDNGMYSQRAILALVKHWKKGEYPEKICWAS